MWVPMSQLDSADAASTREVLVSPCLARFPTWVGLQTKWQEPWVRIIQMSLAEKISTRVQGRLQMLTSWRRKVRLKNETLNWQKVIKFLINHTQFFNYFTFLPFSSMKELLVLLPRPSSVSSITWVWLLPSVSVVVRSVLVVRFPSSI